MGRALELSRSESQRPSTLLGLVQALLDENPDDDVVSRAQDMVATGAVVLTGNFRGCTRLD